MRSPRVPPELTNSFSVDDAARLGVSRGTLRHPGILRPSRGLRILEPFESATEQAQLLTKVLEPPFAFSHITAARIYGLPLPTRWSSAEATHILRPSTAHVVRRPGVISHRGMESRSITKVKGLWVTELGDTWCDLAAMMEFIDLVALGDGVLGRDGIDHGGLDAVIARRGPVRGRVLASEALPWLRAGVRSGMESRARVIFVRGGLPEPEVNAPITNDNGEWLSEGDIAWRGRKLLVEFDGDYHRDRRQWQRDVALRRRIEEAGWTIEVITGDDLLDPPRTAQMLTRFRRLLLD